MPKLILEISEIEKNVNRPVILQAIEDIKQLTGYSKNAKVYYRRFSNQNVNFESVMDSETREGVDFSHSDRVIVTSDIKYADHSIFAAQPFKNNFRPILLDRDHIIALSAINYEVEVDLTLNFISKDRLTLEKWRSNIRRKIGQSVKAYLHRIDYTYPIDYEFFRILKHLYDTKGTLIPNTQSFIEWIGSISHEKITGVTNQIGKEMLPVVELGSIGVYGSWNTTDTPNLDKLEGGDLYQSQINYTLKFSQPSALTLEYPIILNNELISEEFIPSCNIDPPLSFGYPERLIWGLNSTLSYEPKFYPTEPLRIPCFDEWSPLTVPYKTATIYQGLIQVDISNPNFLMDLTDLGDEYELAPWVISFMKLFNKDISLSGATPILVNVYRNQNWMNHDLLYMDPDFKLYSKQPLQLFNDYHVLLSLITDVSTLSENTLKTLRKNGDLTVELFKLLGPNYLDRLPKINSDGSLKNNEMWDFISLLKETHENYKTSYGRSIFTASNCVIAVRRMEDAISH